MGGTIAWSLPPLATHVAAKLFSIFSNVVQGEIPNKRTHNATTQTILLGILVVCTIGSTYDHIQPFGGAGPRASPRARSVGTTAPHARVETPLAREKQKIWLCVTRANSGFMMRVTALCGAVTVPMWNKRTLIGNAPCVGRALMPRRPPMETTPRLMCLGVTYHNGT